ncbi:MAG: hypothetical protein ACI8PW_001358 [Methylophilaceae bacterium]|jgi:hypothetical protein
MLSISVGDNTPYHSGSTKLLLDTTLTLTTNSNLVPIMTNDIVLEDELTVLNNRFANLQKNHLSRVAKDNKLRQSSEQKRNHWKQDLRTYYFLLVHSYCCCLLILSLLGYAASNLKSKPATLKHFGWHA